MIETQSSKFIRGWIATVLQERELKEQRFYIATEGVVQEPARMLLNDINEVVGTVLYIEATGMNNIGKAKNIYAESYAETSEVRAYIPARTTGEQSDISIKFMVVGETMEARQTAIDKFLDMVMNGKHRYWDTCRKRYFDFYIEEAPSISDEHHLDNIPYVMLTVKLKNLTNKTIYAERYSEVFS